MRPDVLNRSQQKQEDITKQHSNRHVSLLKNKYFYIVFYIREMKSSEIFTFFTLQTLGLMSNSIYIAILSNNCLYKCVQKLMQK